MKLTMNMIDKTNGERKVIATDTITLKKSKKNDDIRMNGLSMSMKMLKLYDILDKSKTMLSILDLEKLGIKNPRKILRQMEKHNIVTKHKEYLHNTTKTFTHPKTKKVEVHKGTEVYKYKLVRKYEKEN